MCHFQQTGKIFETLIVVSIYDNILVFCLGKSSIELLEAKTSHVNDHGRLLRREVLPREGKRVEDVVVRSLT